MKRHVWMCALLTAGRLGNALGQTTVDLRTQARNVDFSAAESTKPFKSGMVLPLNCSPGSAFFKLDAPAGLNWYGCTAAGTWALQGGSPVLVGITGKQGSANLLQMFGGGGVNANDCAKFDASNNLVSTGTPCNSATTNFEQSFTSATTVTLTHNANSSSVLVECFDSGTPPARVEYNSLTLSSPNAAVVTFASPQSGKCVVNTAGSPTSGSVTNSGAMTSGMPVLGDGGTTVKVGQIGMAGIAASILTGNGPKLATSAGILTPGNCARFDAAGNVTDAGSPCGTGSGTGTLSTSTGLEGTGSAGDPLRINPTAIAQKLTGWIGWQPGPLAAGGCAVTTIAIPGAAPGDMVAPGWPLGAFQTGANHLVWGEMFVSAAGTVTIKLCNGSASTISFSSETYKAAVLQ